MFHMLSLILVLKQQFIKFSFIKLINGRSQTNWDQKLKILLLQRHYRAQKCQVKFVKNWQNVAQNIDIYYIGIHHNQKNWWLWKYLQCKSFVFGINHANGYIEKRIKINI